jgi:hypothetical protein
MSVDVKGLRNVIRDIKLQIGRLKADVAFLHRVAGDAESQAPATKGTFLGNLGLPSAIVIDVPAAIDEYLWAHSDVADVVRDMAVALVDEFSGEPSTIVLTLEVDDYVDASNLVFIVRVAAYDEPFLDRLDRVAERFDDRLTRSSGWVYPTTDHVPVE